MQRTPHKIPSGRWRRQHNAEIPANKVLRSVRAELDTEWFPDAWAWAGLDEKQPPNEIGDSQPLHLEVVPFLGNRERTVPLIPSPQRLAFQAATLRLLRSADQSLSKNVIAYRLGRAGDFEHYRESRIRRRRLEARYGRTFPVAVRLDLTRFFRNINTKTLDRALSARWEWTQLRNIISNFEQHLGYALPEGYAASRALANLALRDVDRAVPSAFVRWVDDYHVFCHNFAQANLVIRAVSEAAEQWGFAVSEAKTQILASAELLNTDVSVTTHDDTNLDLSELMAMASVANPIDRERLLRHAFRQAAEQSDGQVLRLISTWQPERVPASTIPRLAWLLASAPWSHDSTAVVRGQLEIDDRLSNWRVGRLSYALWYAPSSIASGVLEQFEDRFRSCTAAAGAVARAYARHAPHLLSSVCLPNDTVDRSRILALARAEMHHAGKSMPLGAISVSPPVRSYL